MNNLRIDTGDDNVTLRFPSSYEEMDGPHLRLAAALILNPDDPETLRRFCNIPPRLFSRLSSIQRHAIGNHTGFISATAATASFREWKLPELQVGGNTYHGPISNFGNVSWGEFIYADQCMMQGLYHAAIAAMYRQRRDGYSHETDIRVPFTTYGTVHRHGVISSGLSDSDALSVIINYRAMRRASLEETYTELFPQTAATEDEDDTLPDDTPPAPETEQAPFSWTAVHRSLLGENITDEERMLALPVHTVLYRLNAAIAENRKNRH